MLHEEEVVFDFPGASFRNYGSSDEHPLLVVLEGVYILLLTIASVAEAS